ncbi:hypothetical protein N7475_007338 [Penicillium sp. IBT 31633x]|nr:hypothetical protein N7475_007338 [Penicillium sp. IBT 31633x]
MPNNGDSSHTNKKLEQLQLLHTKARIRADTRRQYLERKRHVINLICRVTVGQNPLNLPTMQELNNEIATIDRVILALSEAQEADEARFNNAQR